MNQPLGGGALTLESVKTEQREEFFEEDKYQFEAQILSCSDCNGLPFDNECDLEKHIIDHHVKNPHVVLHRLAPDHIQKLKQRKGRQRKGAFARKRSQSYLVPRVKSAKKTPLKLKLKVSGDSTSRSFEVIPQKVLIGPGDLYPLNGGVLGEVKTENFLNEVDWEKSLEGSTEQTASDSCGGRTLNEVPSLCEKENSLDSNKSDEDVSADDVVNELDLGHRKDSDNGVILTVEKEELDIPPSPAPTPAPTPLPSAPSPATSPIPESLTPPLGVTPVPVSEALSPTPSEQLEQDFLSSESENTFAQSPNMVEINNTTVADVRSPSFPTTSSPATPSGQPTPPSDQQSSVDGRSADENSGDQGIADSDQLHCGDNGDDATSENFVWTEVSGNDGDITEDASNSQGLEERDPLLLTDPSAPSGDRTGELQGSAVSGLEGFSLGSEYISLERLGDNAVICDVCGERAADQTALQEHKFRSGHFKCTQPECGGVVFSTAEELMAHQQSIHGNQQFSQQNMLSQSQQLMNQQTAPVQQLVQQVQRLPVPQMSLQALSKAPHSSAMQQQLASNMVTLIPSQPNQFQAAVCRPPPLYPAPAPGMMQQHGAPPPYPGPQAQHVMFPQPYPAPGQSFGGSPRQPVQMQPRPYSTMMQQMTQHAMRQQAPRLPGVSVQQRGMVAQGVGSPGGAGQAGKRPVPTSPNSPASKQRRLDMLIPDRHDDADCHVIAMQKRTESGPVITGVQGSTPPASQGSPSSRQSAQSDSTINLTDSITLSVRQPNATPSNGGKSRNDANSVASLLATRGITVTPAGATGRGNQAQAQAQGQPAQPQHRQVVNRQPPTSVPAAPPQPPPPPVTTLNLNSAISIIPTAAARQPPKQPQQQPPGSFAVPQGRNSGRPQQPTQVERPPRPPTVDLTGDGPVLGPALGAMGGRGRGRGRGMMGRNMCQLCDKMFPTPDALSQHMITHRPGPGGQGKLPFRCNMCTAQYPTQQGLLQHRQTYHKESPSQMGSELVLPVVDLKQPATINRLNSLGIRHYIPLSQLSNQSGGVLGLPIVSLEGGRLPSANLHAIGAATILTLGPLRQLPR